MTEYLFLWFSVVFNIALRVLHWHIAYLNKFQALCFLLRNRIKGGPLFLQFSLDRVQEVVFLKMVLKVRMEYFAIVYRIKTLRLPWSDRVILFLLFFLSAFWLETLQFLLFFEDKLLNFYLILLNPLTACW